MTSRPLPLTPSKNPIISTARPLPALPLPSPTSSNCKGSPGSPIALKRRPHTRRPQSTPSSDLPPVSEEDEGDLAEDDEAQVVIKPRRRPRPSPLIPSRSYSSSKMPLILEIPDAPVTFQEQTMKSGEAKSFALSPSTLFARRRSETLLEFPVPPTRTPPSSSRTPPPSHSLSTPVTPPRHSPTPSHVSFSSTSTTDSSPCPLTPTPSDNDENEELRGHSAKENEDFVTIEDFAQVLDTWSPRPFRRSASVVSLRSFNTADFDARVEPIYALMYPRQAPPVPVVQPPRVDPVMQNAQTRKEVCLQVPIQTEARSPHLMLSVLDTNHGGSFDVPLVLGSFLSPPSSPCSLDSNDSESDGEGIPISWSDSEPEDGLLSPALSSSEDDMSDDESPSRVLDPVYRKGTNLPRTSSNGNDRGGSPQLPRLGPLQLDHNSPDTPSVDSRTSPTEWSHDRPLPRGSLVPSDVSSRLSAAPSSYNHHSPSQRHPSPPELRSRFSTSTLASIPEPPTSSKHAFFARLTGRTRPSKGERMPFSPTRERPCLASNSPRGSVRRRAPIPASPAISAFSFSTPSTSSRSSLYSTDSGSCSCLSDESSGSTGLRRPPIPIELFLRG